LENMHFVDEQENHGKTNLFLNFVHLSNIPNL